MNEHTVESLLAENKQLKSALQQMFDFFWETPFYTQKDRVPEGELAIKIPQGFTNALIEIKDLLQEPVEAKD